MATVFSKISSGEIPSYKIADTENCFAFLDINPLANGHVLVVPKMEIDYIFDLEEARLEELIVFAKKIAIAIKKAVPCKKIGMTVIGLEVPHAHIHLIPINEVSDMNFSKTKMSPSPDELSQMAIKIKSYL